MDCQELQPILSARDGVDKLYVRALRDARIGSARLSSCSNRSHRRRRV